MAELDVVLTDVLLMTLRVINTGTTPFQFTSALHTYFRVQDITQVRLNGLHEVEFVDFLRDRKMSVESRAEVGVEGPIDRAYRDSPQLITLVSPQEGVRFLITKEGFSDTVVWNPWIEGASAIGDLAPDDYRNMLCVESGNVLTPVTLRPGETHSSAQIIRAEEGFI
jgi:glucose-6-phosphate 1-epimerase